MLGTDPNAQQAVSSNLQSVPTVDMDGQLLIDKTALPAEKTAKTVELRITLQKYLERLNNK